MNSLWAEGLSVVIPAYNQETVLEKNIHYIQEYLNKQGALFELIVVNDGSTDQTAKILGAIEENLSLRVFTHEKNLGKGRAVATGVLAARFPRVLFLDADLAIPIESTENFLQALGDNNDIVIASRFVPGNTVKTKVLWYRWILERVYWLLRRLIIGLSSVGDTQCGYKLFRTSVAKDLFPYLTCNRFSFDTELLYIAAARGYRIAELPIVLQNPTRSSIRIVRDSTQMLFDLLKMRFLKERGAYVDLVGKAPITFDDFGINEVTNRRIIELLAHPRVRRISVMTTGTWTAKQKEQLMQSGKCLDIHLELPHNKNSERKIHGDFFERIYFFVAQILWGKYTSKKIKACWRQQIEDFKKEFGKYPDGINSHEHVHFFPLFFPITLQLAKDYQIPFVRIGKHGTMPFSLTAFILTSLRFWNQWFFPLRNVQTSSALLSYDWGVILLDEQDKNAEILYHVERDEEYALLLAQLS